MHLRSKSKRRVSMAKIVEANSRNLGGYRLAAEDLREARGMDR